MNSRRARTPAPASRAFALIARQTGPPVGRTRPVARSETNSLYEPKLFDHFSVVTKFDLRLEDCIAGMARLGKSTVDLVVTSPPYNLGVRYGEYSDRQDRQSYLKWW